MHVISPSLLALGLLFAEGAAKPDLANLQEMLHDRQHPQGQSQAALLLVQSHLDGAEKAVRDGLLGTENLGVFLALAAAVRLHQDRRFLEELLAALSIGRPAIRDAAAQTLAVLSNPHLTKRLQELAADRRADLAVRQAALWTLGRGGRKQAVPILLDYLTGDSELLRRAAAAALRDLSGQDFALDVRRWQSWWQRHKEMSQERWMESRLAYQTSRAHRLEGDLARSRAQLLRLQQQLYSRLPTAERVNYIQSLLEQDDPAVRLLAANWSLELLPGAESAQKRLLLQVLLRLSRDSASDVRRAAVLGLGHAPDVEAFERLLHLVRGDPPSVRTAALHALALHARGHEADAPDRRKRVMPLLQKALDDPALEVVVEAAEALGSLGALEAVPVLTGLLRHPSESVRQAAAQALERVADPSVLNGLLGALDDGSATVRFHLVGALAHAAGDGGKLTDSQCKQLLSRLEELLLRDGDPGVRSRAALALGECAGPAQLAALWRAVLAGDDGRVQEKAWMAFVEVLARSGRLPLLQEWDRTLTTAQQGPRRLRMLGDILARWQKQPEQKALLAPVRELLVQAQLESGKWSAALPVLRELLASSTGEDEVNRRLEWLLTAGKQALREGKRGEAMRAVEMARPLLPPKGKLAAGFAKLEQEASRKE